MDIPGRLVFFAAAALTFGVPSGAFAQISPMPSATNAGMTGTPVTPQPETSAHTRGSLPGWRRTDVSGEIPPGAQIKAMKSGSLTRAQVIYGLTHQVREAKQLAKLKTVAFARLRVYRLPPSLKTMFHVSDAESQALVVAMLGEGVRVAQTTAALPDTDASSSPIQYLRDVLADITVSNALENSNRNVALQNVLYDNKIPIGQVVGLYVGGGGIITTISK